MDTPVAISLVGGLVGVVAAIVVLTTEVVAIVVLTLVGGLVGVVASEVGDEDI